MEKWDKNQVSIRFLRQAEDAERYLQEIKGKVESQPTYEHLFDEHLARFYVYNYLHGRTFLSSERELLSELQRMLEYDVNPNECYDIEWFERLRKTYINQEITKLENT